MNTERTFWIAWRLGSDGEIHPVGPHRYLSAFKIRDGMIQGTPGIHIQISNVFYARNQAHAGLLADDHMNK